MKRNPPVLARCGCALLVIALLMIIVTIIPVWFLVFTLWGNAWDLEKSFRFLNSKEVQTYSMYFVILVQGLLISFPLISFLEAGPFMEYFARRE